MNAADRLIRMFRAGCDLGRVLGHVGQNALIEHFFGLLGLIHERRLENFFASCLWLLRRRFGSGSFDLRRADGSRGFNLVPDALVLNSAQIGVQEQSIQNIVRRVDPVALQHRLDHVTASLRRYGEQRCFGYRWVCQQRRYQHRPQIFRGKEIIENFFGGCRITGNGPRRGFVPARQCELSLLAKDLVVDRQVYQDFDHLAGRNRERALGGRLRRAAQAAG